MKKHIYFILSLLSLLISGCTSKQASSESVAIPQIYTSAAMTAISEARYVQTTVSSRHTSTATPFQHSPMISTSTPFVISPPVPRAVANSYSSQHSLSNDCHSASFINDMTFPDGAEVAPGETFVKSWKFENTGSCPWRNTFSIIFRRGDDMGGYDTKIDKVINPGHSVKISVSLTAPGREGTYTGYWMLADASGNAFGNEVSVRIVVSKAAATRTP